MFFEVQFILALTPNGYLTDTYMICPHLTNPKPIYNHYLPMFS